MKLRLSSFFGFCLFCLTTHAQFITGIATEWSDDFIEWNIFTEEDEEGEINMKWQLQRNWTDWKYDLGEIHGSIRLKWPNNPNQWEISGNDDLVTARTLWNGDLTQWRITNNSKTITLKSRWTNNFNEWRIKGDQYGSFEMTTQWDDDPREWIVEDYLDEEISTSMKIAILFIVTYHSSPKDD